MRISDWSSDVCSSDLLVRIRALLPLPSALSKNDSPMPWHRALDLAVAQGQCNSLRGGDRRTLFVHPPNSRKQDARLWFQVLGQIEVGQIPDCQVGEVDWVGEGVRSEEHTSELQSLMRISYAVFCLKKKTTK